MEAKKEQIESSIRYFPPPMYMSYPSYPYPGMPSPSDQPYPILRCIMVKDTAVQTEAYKEVTDERKKTEFTLFPQDPPLQPLIQEKEDKLFMLPDKENLIRLIASYALKNNCLDSQLESIISSCPKPFVCYYTVVADKIRSFKKTKEEMIKFIVRRVWKKQERGMAEARDRYYQEYRSMNNNYLKYIFSEPNFKSAYEKMMKHFDKDFDSFNSDRLNRFYDYMVSCFVKGRYQEFKNSKESKSKLPYSQCWKEEIRKIAIELYENYGSSAPVDMLASTQKNPVSQSSKQNKKQRSFGIVKNQDPSYNQSED